MRDIEKFLCGFGPIYQLCDREEEDGKGASTPYTPCSPLYSSPTSLFIAPTSPAVPVCGICETREAASDWKWSLVRSIRHQRQIKEKWGTTDIGADVVDVSVRGSPGGKHLSEYGHGHVSLFNFPIMCRDCEKFLVPAASSPCHKINAATAQGVLPAAAPRSELLQVLNDFLPLQLEACPDHMPEDRDS